MHSTWQLSVRNINIIPVNTNTNIFVFINHWLILIKTDKKQINIFERKVYRRILGPVCDNEKEKWRILNNKEIYAVAKKPTITETIRLNGLRWCGHVQRMEENWIPKKVLHMNLETRLRGKPRKRWQDEVREDGRLVGRKGWKERIYNREEWKKLLRMSRNHRILHMPMEWMNESLISTLTFHVSLVLLTPFSP